MVKVKQHDIDTSLLEGILTRGDRRVSPALYEAWKRGARLDGWKEHFNPKLWWSTFRDLGIDLDFYTHRQRPMSERLPWDHVNVKKGRAYLEKEQEPQRRATRRHGHRRWRGPADADRAVRNGREGAGGLRGVMRPVTMRSEGSR